MTTKYWRGGAAAVAIVAMAGPVAADVTAAQVWADWESYLRGVGYDIEATTTRDGDTLVVGDTVMKLDLPEDDGQMQIDMGTLRFTETGDGSVQVELAALMPIVLTGTDEEDGDYRVEMTLSQQGFRMSVEGVSDAMTYVYDMDQMALTLTGLSVAGVPVPPQEASGNLRLDNLSGEGSMRLDDLRSYESAFGAVGLSYEMAFLDPDTGDRLRLTGGAEDFSFAGGATLPPEMNPEDFEAALLAGFAIDGSFGNGGGRVDVQVTAEDGPSALAMTWSSGETYMALDELGMEYVAEQTGVAVEISSFDMPFPVSGSLRQIGATLAMPLTAGDAPQDFALALSLSDLEIADVLWNIFDPAEILPRTPADVVMDLTGTVRMLASLVSPEAEASETFRGELETMSLNELIVAAAGARLTGAGSFRFDNTRASAFAGMPSPSGSIELELSGGNALLDRLVRMGLLPDDQAMGARMMMGLFAVPVGDDRLKSVVEITDDGQILANGQRIQ